MSPALETAAPNGRAGTRIEVRSRWGAARTLTGTAAETLPAEARTVVRPGPRPVTCPDLVVAATALSVEVKATATPVTCAPLASSAMAVNWPLVPTSSWRLSGEIRIAATGDDGSLVRLQVLARMRARAKRGDPIMRRIAVSLIIPARLGAPVGADQEDHQPARLGALVAPGVAGPGLEHPVPRTQVHLLPVIQLKPDLPRHHELEVDRVGGVHARVIDFEAIRQAGQLFRDFRHGEPHVPLLEPGDGVGREGEHGESKSADRRKVARRGPRGAVVGKGRGLVGPPEPMELRAGDQRQRDRLDLGVARDRRFPFRGVAGDDAAHFHLRLRPSRQAITSRSPRTASSTVMTGCASKTKAGSIEQNL